MIQKVQHRHLK